ncbi:MAG: hypothetical protein K2J62_02885 [Bacteroidales bacterium]|nr:hypothetical protein [Bacteroidales bacterium]
MKEAKLWAVMFFSSIICAAILRLDIISAGALAAQKSLVFTMVIYARCMAG